MFYLFIWLPSTPLLSQLQNKHFFPTQVEWRYILYSILFSPIWMHLLRSCRLGEGGLMLPSLLYHPAPYLTLWCAPLKQLPSWAQRRQRCKWLLLIGTCCPVLLLLRPKPFLDVQNWLDTVTKTIRSWFWKPTAEILSTKKSQSSWPIKCKCIGPTDKKQQVWLKP